MLISGFCSLGSAEPFCIVQRIVSVPFSSGSVPHLRLLSSKICRPASVSLALVPCGSALEQQPQSGSAHGCVRVCSDLSLATL